MDDAGRLVVSADSSGIAGASPPRTPRARHGALRAGDVLAALGDLFVRDVEDVGELVVVEVLELAEPA
jgi:hypothetical protein